jgi:putative tryptophan/tyrosine transport system substrate-binding protein
MRPRLARSAGSRSVLGVIARATRSKDTLLLAFGILVSALLLTGCAMSGDDDEAAAGEGVRRVGLMHVGIDHIPSSRDALAARLEELGWTEGENIELSWRNLKPEQAQAQAERFVLEDVDLIVAFEDRSIEAAQKATAQGRSGLSRTRDRIPIVFLHPTDPVRDGLVETLAHPGGNITGVFGARDLVGKQLERYQALVPDLRRVLTLVDPEDPNTERFLKEYRAAAAQLPRELDVVIREASTAADLKRVFRSLKPGEADGVFLLSSTLRLNHTALTLRLAKQAGLPVQAHRKEWVEEGALFSYGIDLPLIGRAGARFVDSILRGTPPTELPVEEVPKVEFAINLKTAKELNIDVPPELIIRADKVYR